VDWHVSSQDCVPDVFLGFGCVPDVFLGFGCVPGDVQGFCCVADGAPGSDFVVVDFEISVSLPALLMMRNQSWKNWISSSSSSSFSPSFSSSPSSPSYDSCRPSPSLARVVKNLVKNN